MKTEQGFRIEVASSYGDWWRYNVALMCGCFDAQDNRTDFASTEDCVAEVGANLTKKPAETAPNRHVILDTLPCDHIVLYIYIIPHTLPAANAIGDTQPFDIDVLISYAGKTILSEKRAINQWSGASIEMRVAAE